MKYFIKALKNYALFEGRATRPEYWYFYLFNIIFIIVAICTDMFLGTKGVNLIYALFVFLPGLAVGVRRIHDVNMSGWFILIPFYNLYLLCIKGTEGENQYGSDPQGEPYTFDFEEKEAGV